MTVHNHGTEDGPGLACPERRVGGKLRGKCMEAPAIPAAALDAAVTAYINAARPVGLAEIEAILEAAVPHIAAAAWDEGFGGGKVGDFANPYMQTP